MSNYLNYPASVDPDSLIGRVLGPDTAGALYAVEDAVRGEFFVWGKGVAITETRVRAKMRPLYGQELITVMQSQAVDGDGNRCLPNAKCRVQ